MKTKEKAIKKEAKKVTTKKVSKIRKEPIDIFTKLEQQGVCYAVGIAVIKMKTSEREPLPNDYYIMVHAKDEDKLGGIGYVSPYKSDKKMPTVLEKTMTSSEIRIFKENKDKYVLVQKNEDGRIYELKDNSFRDYYKSTIEVK